LQQKYRVERAENISWSEYLTQLENLGVLNAQDRRLIRLASGGPASLYWNISGTHVHRADSSDIAYYVTATPENEHRAELIEMYTIVFERSPESDVNFLADQ
jgi:hypothetical protein